MSKRIYFAGLAPALNVQASARAPRIPLEWRLQEAQIARHHVPIKSGITGSQH